jgi:hypothetical protein
MDGSGRRKDEMKRVSTRSVLALLACLGATSAVAPRASAVVVHLPGGRFYGVLLRPGVNPASIPGTVAAQRPQSRSLALSAPGTLDYHGGPVVPSSAPYLIFWTPAGENMPDGSETLIERYFADAAADSGRATNVFAVARQFTDPFGFADYRQTFSGSQVINDTQAYPANGCIRTASTYHHCLTDAQLRNELARLIVADGLPTGTGANAPIYFIVTPPDVNICTPALGCADHEFCAYHGDINGIALYAASPFFLSSDLSNMAQSAKGCQHDGYSSVIQEPNGNLADVAVSYMSHEYNETITDPLGTSWFDDVSGNEGGDNCVFAGPPDPANETNPNAFAPTLGGNPIAGTLYDQVINGHFYYTQSEWSNGNAPAKCGQLQGPSSLASARPCRDRRSQGPR